ncbi:MAG: hypothetical protein JNK82_44440 [Myxococcaceae bacterium]|nr:hypothetical protein [Myxococcaceae bacterium]
MALLGFCAAACVGDIETPVPQVDPIVVTPPHLEPPRGFTVPEQTVQLLPFQVRFQRLLAVTGAPATDPMFELLLQNRTSLGAYDYANGVQPDKSWTALRITQWVTALKPICGSQAMKNRFPDLPVSLGPFIEAAYGRSSTADDTSAVTESMTGLTLTAEERRDGICLSILSSMEFIAL